MASLVVVDTDLLIDYLRGRGAGARLVRSLLVEHRPRLTAVTVGAGFDDVGIEGEPVTDDGEHWHADVRLDQRRYWIQPFSARSAGSGATRGRRQHHRTVADHSPAA